MGMVRLFIFTSVVCGLPLVKPRAQTSGSDLGLRPLAVGSQLKAPQALVFGASSYFTCRRKESESGQGASALVTKEMCTVRMCVLLCTVTFSRYSMCVGFSSRRRWWDLRCSRSSAFSVGIEPTAPRQGCPPPNVKGHKLGQCASWGAICGQQADYWGLSEHQRDREGHTHPRLTTEAQLIPEPSFHGFSSFTFCWFNTSRSRSLHHGTRRACCPTLSRSSWMTKLL